MLGLGRETSYYFEEESLSRENYSQRKFNYFYAKQFKLMLPPSCYSPFYQNGFCKELVPVDMILTFTYYFFLGKLLNFLNEK